MHVEEGLKHSICRPLLIMRRQERGFLVRCRGEWLNLRVYPTLLAPWTSDARFPQVQRLRS